LGEDCGGVIICTTLEDKLVRMNNDLTHNLVYKNWAASILQKIKAAQTNAVFKVNTEF